jgi:hypothetical protein
MWLDDRWAALADRAALIRSAQAFSNQIYDRNRQNSPKDRLPERAAQTHHGDHQGGDNNQERVEDVRDYFSHPVYPGSVGLHHRPFNLSSSSICLHQLSTCLPICRDHLRRFLIGFDLSQDRIHTRGFQVTDLIPPGAQLIHRDRIVQVVSDQCFTIQDMHHCPVEVVIDGVNIPKKSGRLISIPTGGHGCSIDQPGRPNLKAASSEFGSKPEHAVRVAVNK